ncbi:M28 family peptidase [candidate division TA06 bacterium]|nr:M28 family peptidase [candidate division TA06 bacterium]
MKTALNIIVVLSLLVGIPTITKADTLIANPYLEYDPVIGSMTAQVDTLSLKYYMESLQSFYNHSIFRSNYDSTVQWLVDQFTMMGISDVRLDSFYHPIAKRNGYNIVATLPGLLDTSIVYITGGHYDTGGTIDLNGDTCNSPGADDNGSGTTAVLEMARLLALPGNRPNCTVRFIAFDAEESGLLGSKHYAEEAYEQNMNIGLMSNYDCIGSRLCDTLYHIVPQSGSEAFTVLLALSAEKYGNDGANAIRAAIGDDMSSDFISFHDLGYHTTHSQEYFIDYTFIHSWHDSTIYINYPAMANIIRSGLGLMATVSNYPRATKPAVKDAGSGTELLINWEPDIAGNIVAYNIYWGRSSGVYTDSATTGLTEYIISGLKEDSLYYVGVIAIDDSGRESPVISETTGIPRSMPLIPSSMTAVPVDSGISLFWKKNQELDIAGYEAYCKIDDGSFDSLTVVTDTQLVIRPLPGANKYYYKVRAFDSDGNYSPFTDSAYARPITLDQGVLLMDETNNWTTGSFPRDAQQDSFYNYILNGYKYEPYEYGTSLQKPILADLGPYSTVAWFSDDYVTLLASGAVNDMKSYLDNGGKLWLAGWKPTGDVMGSASYPDDFIFGNILYDNFKISHAELSSTVDSFKTAIGLKGYPDIAVDTLKYPSTIWGKTFRSIEALTPLAGADTIYVMDMKNNGSTFEGKACAVRDSGKTVFFGFPLYFMDREQVKLAAQKVMAEFGEVPLGVVGKPDNRERISDFRLFQNSPNPFSQQTNISYQLPKNGMVKLNIYNIAGQLVKTLVNSEQQAGSYTVKWNGRDDNGLQASNGVYVCKLEAAGIKGTKKMLLLR